MARKNVLKGLLEPAAPGGPLNTGPVPTHPSGHAAAGGAIGAISRSIADLRARSLVEIDPHLIEAAGMADRLETDSAADVALRDSIAEYGQQVPVLVRPHPDKDGHYQIVYGRRRVLVLRELGQPVRALVRELDDRALVLAQGQENTARRDLSFIEKVNFSRQMQEAGYERKVIGDALSADKTLVSRMLTLAARLPADLIVAIGAAPSIGRDRWTELADLLERAAPSPGDLLAMIGPLAAESSDTRFHAVHGGLARLLARPAPPDTKVVVPLLSPSGHLLGKARIDDGRAVLQIDRKTAPGFDDWLIENLPRLFTEWQAGQPGKS